MSDLIDIAATTHRLGWRFDDRLPEGARAAIEEHLGGSWSATRTVTLPAYRIACDPIPLHELVGDPYDLDEDVDDLEPLCDLVDRALAERGLRVPTEDELEAAFAGALFPWGDTVPDGVPYGSETSFTAHRAPLPSGLRPLGDPYQVELARHAFMLGDGGTSICGGAPWPVPWLTLSPAYRHDRGMWEECFLETLEQAWVRPVAR